MRDINREHPEYTAWKSVWPKYRDLYAGGEQLTANADRYLIPRQKEPAAVYRERVARAFYENYTIDHRLVRGDAVPAGADCDVRRMGRAGAAVLQ